MHINILFLYFSVNFFSLLGIKFLSASAAFLNWVTMPYHKYIQKMLKHDEYFFGYSNPCHSILLQTCFELYESLALSHWEIEFSVYGIFFSLFQQFSSVFISEALLQLKIMVQWVWCIRDKYFNYLFSHSTFYWLKSIFFFHRLCLYLNGISIFLCCHRKMPYTIDSM